MVKLKSGMKLKVKDMPWVVGTVHDREHPTRDSKLIAVFECGGFGWDADEDRFPVGSTCWYLGEVLEDEPFFELAEPAEPTAPMERKVLDVLKRKGSLTSLEAGGMLKCRDLPKRVSELIAKGWPIKKERKRDPHDGQRYTRYHLEAI